MFTHILFTEEKPNYASVHLKTYSEFWMFYKTSLKKIKEFEINTIKNLMMIYKEKHYYFTFSKDLIKSTHLLDFICLKDSNEKKLQRQQKKETISLSRIKLNLLFYSIVFEAFKKCCELNKLGIEKSFEKEMVEGIKSIFYPMTLNVDNRNNWYFPLIATLQKKEPKFNIRMDIPNIFNYRIRCTNCKINYSNNYKSSTCKKCGYRVYQVKEKPSRSYLKNRFNKIDELQTKMDLYLKRFSNYMCILRDSWFGVREIKKDFQKFFDEASKGIQILKMSGKIHYSIVHYDKEKSKKKKECYISEESDFMNISIRLKEYYPLLRNFIKAEIYGIGKDKTKLESKLIALLSQLNFPERFIFSKIKKDFEICKEFFYFEQLNRISTEYVKYFRNIQIKIQRNAYSDPMTLLEDIEIIPYKCINFIYKKKLIPIDEMNILKNTINHYIDTNQELPRNILFKILPKLKLLELPLESLVINFYKKLIDYFNTINK
jgi:hypothetical protein